MEADLSTRVAERRFRVMGTDAHIVVHGQGTLLDGVERRLHDLEARWSRFRDTSEVSLLNAARGQAVVVSPEVVELVAKAAAGSALTDGRFNPLQANRMVRLGYDRSFFFVSATDLVLPDVAPAPSCALIEIDEDATTVRIPSGSGFDPGAIGKGLAADIVSDEVMAGGADGVMINLGGDIRVQGRPPSGDRWVIAVHEPAWRDEPITHVHLSEGAVATSTTLRRQWAGPDGRRHHLLDPETGRPIKRGPVVATAVSGAGWLAEVGATAAMSETASDEADTEGCAILRVLADGTQQRSNGFERYEPCSAPS